MSNIQERDKVRNQILHKKTEIYVLSILTEWTFRKNKVKNNYIRNIEKLLISEVNENKINIGDKISNKIDELYNSLELIDKIKQNENENNNLKVIE